MQLYSATTRGFYDTFIHRPEQIPQDAKPLGADEAAAAAEYDRLFVGQADGKLIQPDENGDPQLVDNPGTSPW